ncbi:MAG: DUF4377 domain-containing protein [Bacteroidales bacterium]|nr:DUF4377 domain-containing protein [Bacteroidales bacterium]
MNKKTIITTLLATIFGLASCSSDNDNEDKVEQVTVYVSAETGTYTPLFSDEPVEGMLIQEKGNTRWSCVHFATITGFTYEKENEYELLVKKTTLANPPQDDVNIRYELISIVSQKKID